MSEEWKDIEQLKGDYQISTLGRVRRAKECIGQGAKSTYVGKVLKTFVHPNGYSLFRSRYRGFRFRVHRLVAEAFIPNPLNKPHVNHINGIKTDNRVDNLEWCTVEENNSHNDTLTIRRFLSLLDANQLYSKPDLEALLPHGEGTVSLKV